MDYNRARMKQEVKRIMGQTRPRPIWLTLLYFVIVNAGVWLIQTVLGGITGLQRFTQGLVESIMISDGDMEWAMERFANYLLINRSVIFGMILGSFLVGILSYLWQSLMNVSYEGYSLSMVRGENPPVKALFCAFPRVGSVLLTRILTGVFIFLWTLLFSVGLVVVIILGALLLEDAAVLGVLLMIVGYVAFLIGVCWVTLRYALVDYVLMDQGLSGLEALRGSKQLMKGNKGRLFVLQLSFIGWYLLEMLIIYVGIIVIAVIAAVMIGSGSVSGYIAATGVMLLVGLLMVVAVLLFSMWLTPYVTGSVAKFYEFVKGARPELSGGWSDTYTTYTDDSFGNPNYPKLD